MTKMSQQEGVRNSLFSSGSDCNENVPRDAITLTAAHVVFGNALRNANLVKLRNALEMDGTLANKLMKDGRSGVHPLLYLAKITVKKDKVLLEMIEELLKHQADANSRDHWGRNALHHAVKDDNLELVRLLLQYGSEVDAKDSSGGTPLQFARTGEITQLLVTNGADTNSRDTQGSVPLLKAVMHDNFDVFRILVENGADIHATDSNGWASIHGASIHEANTIYEARNNIDFLQYLLDSGADVNARTANGSTPLMCGRWNLEVTQLLLQHGADVNAQDLDGNTVFSYCRTVEMAQLLLDYGADITYAGAKALHWAVDFNCVEMVRFLLQIGVDANAETLHKRTPLQAAFRTSDVRERKAQIVKSLIDFGADVNARESDTGLSVLHRACQLADDASMIKVLLQNGADIHVRNNEGWTPLLWASAFSRWRIVRKLVKHGAIINDRAQVDSTAATYNNERIRAKTPLSVACSRKQAKVVRYLLDAGACVDYRDHDGSTPLLHAVLENDYRCARLLLQRGADIHARQPQQDSTTPFFLACERGSLNMIYSMIRLSPHHQRPQPM